VTLQDVLDKYTWELATSLDYPNVFMGGPSEHNKKRAREILAVVIPAIAQECAKLAEEIAYEYIKEWRAGFKSDSYLEGKSDGADEVAYAIRQRFKTNG
jgi:hypothetical protein